eukprot:CAMPEP_0178985598 /NCGR_PEP_ID=MMETSP0795-20121207/2239_1 /TAXON_ID=88552 /ORGANISM="Amoebophrya sp., Strain Ameob2" /LENGTH=140 /DNA_ID=CAMNT_0020676569 /DNA_START=1109 /DNA_END=1531 /DNA_ORIENTATION=-
MSYRGRYAIRRRVVDLEHDDGALFPRGHHAGRRHFVRFKRIPLDFLDFDVDAVALQGVLAAETEVLPLHLRVDFSRVPEDVRCDVAHGEALPVVRAAEAAEHNRHTNGIVLHDPDPIQVRQVSHNGLNVAHSRDAPRRFV